MNKIFAIGDIHGCLEKLQALITNIGADPQNDTLIFIGDYIDRGNSSREVVDYVIRLKKEYKKVVCLLGNHEYMLIRYQGLELFQAAVNISYGKNFIHHGYEPQRKLWKQIQQQAAEY